MSAAINQMTAADRGAYEHAERQPTAVLLAQRRNALLELAHIADLAERPETWTAAERFEAQYSPQRAANAYRRLNAATHALALRDELPTT